MKRTVTLLADDLQEAREKLLAVRLGLKAIYGEDFAEPVMEGEQSLDELVVWLREVIRFLDLESQQEANYELVIPLGQKWRASEEPIVAAETLWQAVDQQGPEKVIHFKLEDVFFNQEHVRLRAVGLAFGPQPELTDLTMLDRFGFWRLRATIHTPKQRGVQTSTDYYRPPIVLGNVSAYGRSIPVAMRSGPECHNVDPRGEWTIVLNRYSVWCDSQAKSIEKMAQETRTIADLKLFLSVVAKPSKAAISVFTPCSV